MGILEICLIFLVLNIIVSTLLIFIHIRSYGYVPEDENFEVPFHSGFGQTFYVDREEKSPCVAKAKKKGIL